MYFGNLLGTRFRLGRCVITIDNALWRILFLEAMLLLAISPPRKLASSRAPQPPIIPISDITFSPPPQSCAQTYKAFLPSHHHINNNNKNVLRKLRCTPRRSPRWLRWPSGVRRRWLRPSRKPRSSSRCRPPVRLLQRHKTPQCSPFETDYGAGSVPSTSIDQARSLRTSSVRPSLFSFTPLMYL